MGAYENPRFFSVDYTAGVRAFQASFQQGLAMGEKIYQQRKEDREDYVEGIYEEGAKLEEELNTLTGNVESTKEVIQKSLDEFYDTALKVEKKQPGLKGLFKAPEETRIEGQKLKEFTNSFKSATASVKALNTIAADVETIPSEDLDLGGEGQEKQLYYASLQKSGRLKTNFDFTGKGFKSSFEVLDANGKPTGEVISSQEMNLIMNTDTRAARTAINNSWDAAYVKKEGDASITANVQNKIDTKFTKASYDGEKEYIEAEEIISTEIDRTNGMEGYLNDNGDLNIKNEDGTYDFSKLPDISNVNNIYNNIVKASAGEKLSAFEAAFPNSGLNDDQIDRIMDKAMKVGIGGLKNDRIIGVNGPLKIDENKYKEIYGASLVAKHKLTRDYQIQAIRNNGVLDKFNKPAEDSSSGGGGGDGENKQNLLRYFTDVDNLTFTDVKGVGPTIDGKPMVDFNELEPKLSKPPFSINVKKSEMVGARQARQFTKTVEGADRTVTIFDNATPDDIRKALKYLETGENYNFSTNVTIPNSLPIFNN